MQKKITVFPGEDKDLELAQFTAGQHTFDTYNFVAVVLALSTDIDCWIIPSDVWRSFGIGGFEEDIQTQNGRVRQFKANRHFREVIAICLFGSGVGYQNKAI